MTSNEFRLGDVRWNQWYRVLIGFAKEPEIRSGDCVRSLIRSGASLTVLGPIGEMQDIKTYAAINNIEI
jgi:hypothetical protein